MFVTRRYIVPRGLLRASRVILRSKSTRTETLDSSKYDFLTESKENTPESSLPFDRRRHSESFGQLVRSEYLEQTGNLNSSEVQFVKKTNFNEENEDDLSPYRNPDGSFIHGSNSEEARLDPLTLLGRVDHRVTVLPHEISKVIQNNILLQVSPDKLRERAALVYQSLEKEQIQKAPELSVESDAHIAALFLQDYAHLRRALLELKSRVGTSFNPQNVLDVGYGPATGMVALNEIMGDDYSPVTKDAYVVGRSNTDMKKRAKIILSRQLCELPEDVEESGVTVNAQEALEELDEEIVDEEIADEADKREEYEEEYVGPVDASRIIVRTKLRDSLPSTKQYDLIMVNQALLTREYNFPRDVDINIHMILKLLTPNGHLVLVERGNALGFEIIARARQIMLRPESFEGEVGKIPRPYIRGSSIKPQKLRREDQLINEEHIEYEEDLLSRMEEEDRLEALAEVQEQEELEEKQMEMLDEGNELLEDEINAKYGEVSEEELRFEFEDSDEFEIVSPDKKSKLSTESVDYHMSVVAPCPHHGRCPLQLGDPKLYKISNHKHRLSFCSFNQVVERPRYTMELKKGRRLATLWDKSAEDGFGLEKLSKLTLKSLAGTGRPGGNNTESGNFSYLIMQRSPNSVNDIQKIESDRAFHNEVSATSDIGTWPRILDFPSKIKNNVKLNVCAPSGNMETWQVPKSLGKQAYHDARKVRQGDLWALEKKGVVVKNKLSDANLEKLNRLAKSQRKFVLKEQRKKTWKKVVSASQDAFEDVEAMSDELAMQMESSKKYKTKGKRAQFDVDPRSYDGK